MTKEDIEKIIGKLGEKDKVFVPYMGDSDGENEQAPILIGDVLERIRKVPKTNCPDIDFGLCSVWSRCGYSKSLQTIAEEGWEEACRKCRTGCKKHTVHYKINQLKAAPLALFNFLQEIL